MRLSTLVTTVRSLPVLRRSLTGFATAMLVAGAAHAETRTVCKTGGSGLNIRYAPSIHAGRAGAVADGTDMTMLGLSRNGGWVKVKVGGKTGWVSRKFVCNGGGSASSG